MFMEPEIRGPEDWYSVETDEGGFYYPCNEVDKGMILNEIHPDLERETLSDCVVCDAITVEEGKWGVRLSASGYMDRTDWTVFSSQEECIAYLEEAFDIIPCSGCKTWIDIDDKQGDKQYCPPCLKEREPLPFPTDDFTMAYIECMLWSTMDNATEQGGEPLDANYSWDDFSPALQRQVIEDCEEFSSLYESLIDGDDKHAGHDFWLTREGHGAGFWDGDWEEPAATVLTKASETYGSFDIYVGNDGVIYHVG